MKLAFAEPTYDAVMAQGAEDLLRAHWREVAHDHDEIPLAIDHDRYRMLADAGVVYILTLSDGPMLVGYNVFFVMPHPHYRTTLHASNDIVYVKPEYRGEAGIRLILEAEKRLRARGKVKLIYHSKDDLLLAAGARGEGAGDSLDRVEALVDIESDYAMNLPDDLLADDMTLGGLLKSLGYRKTESIYTKLLR